MKETEYSEKLSILHWLNLSTIAEVLSRRCISSRHFLSCDQAWGLTTRSLQIMAHDGFTAKLLGRTGDNKAGGSLRVVVGMS